MKPVYDLAKAWVARCLRVDGSLITPSRPIWTQANLDELYKRTHGNPQTSAKEDFEVKFQRQLAGAPADIYQLAAEELVIYSLVSYEGALSRGRKREMVTEVLSWGGVSQLLTTEVEGSFETGLVHPGVAYGTYKPMQLWFLLDVARRLKALPSSLRDRMLDDPRAFREFIFSMPVNSAQTMREALLHLVHPDHFEAITAEEDKRRLVRAFGSLVVDKRADTDEQIADVRKALTPEHGVGFDFYGESVRPLWKPKVGDGPVDALWRVTAGAGARSIQHLFSRRIHEHFPAYLGLVRLAAASKAQARLRPNFKGLFDEFFVVPGGPQGNYLRPFSSRQKTPETLWLNPNIAGSLSASSLRDGKAFMEVVEVQGKGTGTTYALRSGHAALAREHLADGQRVPVAELAAFLYRNEEFASKEQPNVALLVDVFTYEFGYDTRREDFAELYEEPGPEADAVEWFELL